MGHMHESKREDQERRTTITRERQQASITTHHKQCESFLPKGHSMKSCIIKCRTPPTVNTGAAPWYCRQILSKFRPKLMITYHPRPASCAHDRVVTKPAPMTVREQRHSNFACHNNITTQVSRGVQPFCQSTSLPTLGHSARNL